MDDRKAEMARMIISSRSWTMQDKRCMLLQMMDNETKTGEEEEEYPCPSCGKPQPLTSWGGHVDMCGRSLEDVRDPSQTELAFRKARISELLHIANLMDVKEVGQFGMTSLHFAAQRFAPADLFGGTAQASSLLSNPSEYCTGPLPWDVMCLVASFNPDKFRLSCKGLRRQIIHNEAVKITEVLLSRQAKVDAYDDRGWTALHYAAFSGNHLLCDLLLKNGADVNALCKGGTPLHLAAITSSTEAAAVLLAHKADPTILSHLWESPLSLARSLPHPHHDLLTLIESYL
eukprot:TRINITY_DN20060_c0_g1_i1.p1 TRINITY_DN20060_c0_g1~~TRINITY_DN20060_c0_g1_i1.p1  ORF type:complete len:288 (+),score=49.51 TRINITY_DN20060_c0_g1_i1:60-923(+)